MPDIVRWLNHESKRIYGDDIERWVAETRCPGCEKMHLVHPCFPDCYKCEA